MSEIINIKLQKNLLNLKQQKIDSKLENIGHKVITYFDAYDILESIIGFSRFFSGDKFKETLFNSKSTLVQCLATSGNLGGIHLLVPHKAELFTQLKILKSKFEPKIDKRAKAFTKKTGFYSEEFDWLEANNNTELKKNIINSITAESAGNFFRTVHNLAPWYKRLKEIIDTNKLVISSQDNDSNIQEIYLNIFKSGYFQQLKKIFAWLRPRTDRSKNNLTDAISIAILIEKTKLIVSSKDNLIEHPRFLAPFNSLLSIFSERDEKRLFSLIEELMQQNNSNLKNITKIVEETLKIQERLSYEVEDSFVSVIQNEDYFIYRAISKPNETGLNEQDKFKIILERLNNWEKQTAKFFEVSNQIASPHLEQIHSSWEEVINKREKEFFFKEVWLNPLDKVNSQAFKDLEKAIADTVEAYEEFKFEQIAELNKKNDLLIRETEQKVKNEINDAEVVLSLVEKLDKKVSSNKKITDLKNLFKDSDNLRRQFWNYFPIYRYSFDPSKHEETITLLKQLLNSNSTAKLTLQCNFVELLEIDIKDSEFKNIQQADLTRKLEETTAILYALQLKEELWYLLSNYRKQMPHFSFSIILGELYLDKNVDLKDEFRNKEAKKIIDTLQSNFQLESDTHITKCKLAIGLSVLYYWRWKKDGGESLWADIQIDEKENDKQKKKEGLIDKAITYANQAYLLSSDDSDLIAENLYALNLSVFFLAVSNNSNDDHIKELLKLGEKLEQLSVKDEYNDIWQFRYDDTIARFYGKLAGILTGDVNCSKWLERANEHLASAYEKAPNDQTVLKTKRTIRNIETKISHHKNSL